MLTGELDGEKVTKMGLDEWARPNTRPGGTARKFDTAYKDHPRKGHIGLQDHGSPPWFKSVKIKPLKRLRLRRLCPLHPPHR